MSIYIARYPPGLHGNELRRELLRVARVVLDNPSLNLSPVFPFTDADLRKMYRQAVETPEQFKEVHCQIQKDQEYGYELISSSPFRRS